MHESEEYITRAFESFSTRVLISSELQYTEILESQRAERRFYRNCTCIGSVITAAYAGFAGYSFSEVAHGGADMSAPAIVCTTLAGITAWMTRRSRDSMKSTESKMQMTETLLIAAHSALEARYGAA